MLCGSEVDEVLVWRISTIAFLVFVFVSLACTVPDGVFQSKSADLRTVYGG